MKEKILWIGMIAIIISWIGNYLYFQSKQLEHPIFLEHYYETYLEDEHSFSPLTFYYLTNKNDNTEILDIMIDEITAFPTSDGFFMWDSDTPQYVQEFSHHYLKSVTLELPKSEEGSNDSWSFEEITVTFSNGKSLTTNIGHVKVYDKIPYNDVFDSRFSSSSSDLHHGETMFVNKPLTIDAINIPFSQDISKDIFVTINFDQEKLKELEKHTNAQDWIEEQTTEWKENNGISIREDFFPLSLEKEDRIGIYIKLNPDRKSYMSFGVEMTGTTVDGESFTQKSFIMDHPYLSQQAVDEIIAEEMEGE